MEYLVDPYLITILFTWLVIGMGCYSMFVLPQRLEKGAQQAARPMPAEELRKAA